MKYQWFILIKVWNMCAIHFWKQKCLVFSPLLTKIYFRRQLMESPSIFRRINKNEKALSSQTQVLLLNWIFIPLPTLGSDTDSDSAHKGIWINYHLPTNSKIVFLLLSFLITQVEMIFLSKVCTSSAYIKVAK